MPDQKFVCSTHIRVKLLEHANTLTNTDVWKWFRKNRAINYIHRIECFWRCTYSSVAVMYHSKMKRRNLHVCLPPPLNTRTTLFSWRMFFCKSETSSPSFLCWSCWSWISHAHCCLDELLMIYIISYAKSVSFFFSAFKYILHDTLPRSRGTLVISVIL